MWSYIKVVLWQIAFAPVWLLTVWFKKDKTNCLEWALDKWDTEGGYLVVRWCRHNKYPMIRWPHFLWLPDEHGVHLQHLVPSRKKNKKRRLPQPWFHGVVMRGDNEDTVEN